MKKVFLMMVGCIMMLQTAFADNDVVTTDTNHLPVATRDFIRKHFKELSVSHIKIEKNLLGIKSYDVILTSGCDLEFDKQGVWTEIDGKRTAIPETVIPTLILDYQKKNFANQQIVSIDKNDTRGYDVKLTNGLELKFDAKCSFIRYDD